jgi:hypothetical protein
MNLFFQQEFSGFSGKFTSKTKAEGELNGRLTPLHPSKSGDWMKKNLKG